MTVTENQRSFISYKFDTTFKVQSTKNEYEENRIWHKDWDHG